MSLAHYLLQANLYLFIFYGFYKILLSNETWFKLNRLYLVLSSILAFTIPFLRFNWVKEQPVSKQVYGNISLIIDKATYVQPDIKGIDWGNMMAIIYFAGVVISILFLIFRLLALRKTTKNPFKGQAFSFFGQKYIDDTLPGVDIINRHEEVHVKQLHSMDIIVIELIAIISWFNPIIYLYKKAIRNIHEYLADEEAANFQGDKRTYALLLLSNAFGLKTPSLGNNFFKKSMIKKRIVMLQKERSKRTGILKYGLLVPIFALFIILSSATIRKNEELLNITKEISLEKNLNTVKEILTPENDKTIISSKSGNTVKVTRVLNTANQDESKEPDETVPVEEKDNKIYDFVSVEKQPEFPGGIRKFYEYVGKTIKYPALAQENNVQGKVFLSFTVETDGSLTDVKITRGLGSGTDEEALRVIKSSPKWNPGIKDGGAVRVRYNLNVNFTLNNTVGGDLNTKSQKLFYKSYDKDKIFMSGGVFDGIVVLDGVRLEDNSILGTLNPNNIESISVLKDQSATSIYGLKGRNGVLIISTKTAKGNTFKKLDVNDQAIFKPSNIELRKKY